MTFHIVISIILILVSIMFFDFEFSALRGSKILVKSIGQAMFSVWFAVVAALALFIPLTLELLKHKMLLGLVGQVTFSFVVYIMWFLTARWLYNKVMKFIYHGTVTGEYRCQVASDDVDIVPE